MGNRSNINLVGNTTEGQNVGSGDGVYKGKNVGNILQYKSLSVTGTTMVITTDAENIYFSANTGGAGDSIGWSTSGTTGSTVVGCETPSYTTSLLYHTILGTCAGKGGIAIGNKALENHSGSPITNIAIGNSAINTSTGTNHSTAIGHCSLAALSSGGQHVAVGNSALRKATAAYDNVAIGLSTLCDNLSGGQNTAVGSQTLGKATGGHNSVLGGYAMQALTTGVGNVAMGYQVGHLNSTGCYNVLLGYRAGYTETTSNKLHIANDSGCTLICGDFTGKTVTIDNKLITTDFQMTNGAAAGCFLCSDASGNASWATGGGGGGTIDGAVNGVSLSTGGNEVKLGGNLTGATTINVNATCLLSVCSTGGNDLRFYVGNVIYGCYNSGSNIGSRFCMDQQSRTTLGYCLSSNFYGFFNCGSTCAELKRYAGVNDCSYVKLTSAGLTLSSTDAIYVNGLTGKTSETSVLYLNSAGFLTTGTTAGGGGLSASDNGLCDNGTTVGLGGTLANDTDISGDDHTHSISMSPLNFTLSAGTNINLCTYFGSSSINLNANSGVIDMCGCSSRMVIGAYGILPAGIYLPTLPEKTSETNVVYIDGDGQLLSGATAGGGSPGGATTNVQFNHNDSFSGTSAFTFTGSHVGVTGTITSSGDMTATDFVLSSDESLKTCICQYIPTPIDVSYREYEFCNKPGNQRYGVIAQELNQTQPELVRCDNDGVMSVSYIDLLVREVAYLKNKVEELEKKIG